MILCQIGANTAKNSIVENQNFFDSIFKGVFSNKFLDSHIIANIVLDPENLILAKKFKFGDTRTSILAILGDPPKITKNGRKSSKMPFWQFWWADMIKISANYVWKTFRDISEQKVLIKKNFCFCTEKPWFFKKKIRKAQNPPFWAQKPGWMGFSWSFNDKLVVGTQNEGGSKKGTTNP